MKEDYINARKLGEKARTKAFLTGRYPYLPALDEMIGGTSAASEIPLGVHEIPLHLIVGTKTSGRKNAFAYNFMPLLDPSSEFALKWASLYEYQKNEGLRDPIKVYEYMGRFYVEEGNKRVSVMNYFKSYSISADVIRIMPPRTDDLENVVYYEFLDFFKVTRFFEIQFSQKGSYQKLAEQMGESLDSPWPEEKMEILRDGFRRFAEIYEQKGGRPEGITDGDAYLTYITVFPPESLVYGVETGVGLVEEKVLGVAGQRTGDGGALLHTTAQLRRIQLVRVHQINAFETEVGAVTHLALTHVREHVQREGDVFLNCHGVEQRGTLEHHPHFLAEQQFVLFRQVVELPAAVENFALLGRVQPHQALHQHRLARPGTPDDQIHLALLEPRVDTEKHLLLAEIFGNVVDFDHLV